MQLRSAAPSFAVLLLCLGCGGSQPAAEPLGPPPPPAELPPAAVETQSSAGAGGGGAVTAAPPPASPPRPVVRFAEGISTPESVLYDAEADRYLVSNINGGPSDADGNGYIADLSPDGKVNKDKFIAGGTNKVKLDAPKGMGISNDVLYVTDITVVRKFDLKTGAPKGNIPIAGATFLNDIAVASDGRVFVSDSGVKASANGFDPTGTDAVYVLEKDRPRALAKTKDLGGPNGLLFNEAGLLVNTIGSNELYRLDEKGVRQDITKLPEGMLDGLVALGTDLLVTSWSGAAVYRGTLGGTFQMVLPGLKGPADIGWDAKRNRVLVPRFMDNAVEVYELPAAK